MSEDNLHGEAAIPTEHKTVEDHVVGVDSVSIMSRYEVSESAYNFAKSCLKKCQGYSELCDKATDTLEKIGHLLNEMQMSMACFVFCGICLEAYINSYAGDRLSKDKFSILVWEKLERCLNEKWKEVPELVLGKTFETDKEPYKSLKWLYDKRNFIVHYKGKYSELEMIDRLGVKTDRIFNQFTVKEAERAFQLVEDMIKGLHSLDNSKIPDWLV